MKKNSFIDFDDLEVKYLSGQYIGLEYVKPGDIIYYLVMKKKIEFSIDDLIKAFSAESLEVKINQIHDCIEKLVHENLVEKTETGFKLVK